MRTLCFQHFMSCRSAGPSHRPSSLECVNDTHHTALSKGSACLQRSPEGSPMLSSEVAAVSFVMAGGQQHQHAVRARTTVTWKPPHWQLVVTRNPLAQPRQAAGNVHLGPQHGCSMQACWTTAKRQLKDAAGGAAAHTSHSCSDIMPRLLRFRAAQEAAKDALHPLACLDPLTSQAKTCPAPCDLLHSLWTLTDLHEPSCWQQQHAMQPHPREASPADLPARACQHFTLRRAVRSLLAPVMHTSKCMKSTIMELARPSKIIRDVPDCCGDAQCRAVPSKHDWTPSHLPACLRLTQLDWEACIAAGLPEPCTTHRCNPGHKQLLGTAPSQGDTHNIALPTPLPHNCDLPTEAGAAWDASHAKMQPPWRACQVLTCCSSSSTEPGADLSTNLTNSHWISKPCPLNMAHMSCRPCRP